MIPTLAIATADDARLIGFALWDAGQSLRRMGEDGTRCFELSSKAFEECRRIEREALSPTALFL